MSKLDILNLKGEKVKDTKLNDKVHHLNTYTLEEW